MLMLDADKILNSLSFTALVDELSTMHGEPIGLVDEMLMESRDANDNVSHFFIRTGWQPEKAVGAKVITVFPRNNQRREWPSIQAVYILFEGVNGTPIACLDGTALTWIKTATDSALGSRLLSRENIETMLMIGAGQIAPHLVSAHCTVRASLKQVQIWNRTGDKAAALCASLTEKFPQIAFTPVREIEASAREADLICSAIGCETPIIEGAWLKPGVHVDCNVVRGGGSAARDRVDLVDDARVDLTQVKDLNAAAAFTHGVGVVLIDLHVAPQAGGAADQRDDFRIGRILQADEGRSG